MKRMTKREEVLATQELIEWLREYPDGLSTNQLTGTKHFHGRRTLSPRQVARLLRASGLVEHSYEGTGCMAASWWRLKRADSGEVKQ